MSKADFINVVSKQGKVSKADAKRAVELVFDAAKPGISAFNIYPSPHRISRRVRMMCINDVVALYRIHPDG